jgi:SNF2 family DNA or RNA helicase
MGQSKAVSVYRLIMKESVEEKVEILKTRKGLLFDQMFGENYSSRENAESVEMSVGKDSAGGAMLTKQDFDLLLS